MLDVVAAAAVEVAGAAVGAPGQVDTLGDGGQVDGRLAFEHHRAGWAALGVGRLVIGAGGLVADKAVDIALIAEVEGLVLPAVAGVALRAHALVAARVGAEVIDQVALAELLAGVRVLVRPGPVNVLHEVLASLGMAAETGLGHFRAGRERALQLFEFCVIRGAALQRSGDLRRWRGGGRGCWPVVDRVRCWGRDGGQQQDDRADGGSHVVVLLRCNHG